MSAFSGNPAISFCAGVTSGVSVAYRALFKLFDSVRCCSSRSASADAELWLDEMVGGTEGLKTDKVAFN